MKLIYKSKGYEIWAQYARSAKVWELFASDTGEDYLGCVDTLQACYTFAKEFVAERLASN